METEIDRRVTRKEFQAILGYADTWMRQQEARGVIPQGFRDPGGRRTWWPLSVVRATMAKLTKAAVPSTPLKLPSGCNQKGSQKTAPKTAKPRESWPIARMLKRAKQPAKKPKAPKPKEKT